MEFFKKSIISGLPEGNSESERLFNHFIHIEENVRI